MRTSQFLSSCAVQFSFHRFSHNGALGLRPSSARRTHGLRRGFNMALVCVLGSCALPSLAHAQEVRTVPGLSDLPLVGKLFVSRQDAPVGVPVSTPAKSLLVSIEAKSVPFGQLVDLLMDQAHVSYTLDAKLAMLPTGNVKLRKVPFNIALETILKMTNFKATYLLENGIYRIVTLEEAEAEKQTGNVPLPVVLAPGNNVEDKLVSLEYTNSDLYTVLKQLFAQVHANWTLVPGLRSYQLTAQLKNVPFRVALPMLLRSIGKTTDIQSGKRHLQHYPERGNGVGGTEALTLCHAAGGCLCTNTSNPRLKCSM